MSVSAFSQKMLDSDSTVKLVSLYKNFQYYYGIYSTTQFWGRVEDTDGNLEEFLTTKLNDASAILNGRAEHTSIFTAHGYNLSTF